MVTIAVALATRPLKGGVTGAADAAAILAGSLGSSCAVFAAGLPTPGLVASFTSFAWVAGVLPCAPALPGFAAAAGRLAIGEADAAFPASLRVADLTGTFGTTAALPRRSAATPCLPAATFFGAGFAAVLAVAGLRGAGLVNVAVLPAGLFLGAGLPKALPAVRVAAALVGAGVTALRLGEAVWLEAADFFAVGLAAAFFTAGGARLAVGFTGALAMLRTVFAAGLALLAGRLAAAFDFTLAAVEACVLTTPLPGLLVVVELRVVFAISLSPFIGRGGRVL